jgi:hypothetical protein
LGIERNVQNEQREEYREDAMRRDGNTARCSDRNLRTELVWDPIAIRAEPTIRRTLEPAIASSWNLSW